ncbi:NRDE family protein [Alterisphingorhabdus coralli]|uniref:NRDE family protein n=1 Tax=Alterisphingorhabdus coralli TaxID=3071408 RepID=A0AA97F660_9SPHN|nr:NRDE family protein [Parasphingorhabdus sp. SCSIO 66989]WOE73827.1 NRDE family protein [Parasphingorhabdus sp. SCSIO 66989]
MCVVALAWKAHADWPLVLIGNRDEFHARPSTPLAVWPDGSGIIAGRDEQSGGTWLGVTERRRLAVITNRRNPNGPDPDKLSRGAIVTDALTKGISSLKTEPALTKNYNGFSLLSVDQDSAWLTVNQPKARKLALDPGLYGLANGDLDEPWPKTLRIKQRLADWLGSPAHDPGALLDDLRSDDSPQVTPDRAEQSPIFILNPAYGTRCSTVVMVNAHGEGKIIERRYDKSGKPFGETREAFVWT